MLSYAQGVLESQVRIATVAHGLDPMFGYQHVRASRPTKRNTHSIHISTSQNVNYEFAKSVFEGSGYGEAAEEDKTNAGTSD